MLHLDALSWPLKFVKTEIFPTCNASEHGCQCVLIQCTKNDESYNKNITRDKQLIKQNNIPVTNSQQK